MDILQVNHMRNYKMKMRMGIHSGSCVGGVVGSKMPHFSVFGDTVNIAALMESTSEPMRVQISHTTMVCKIILSLGVRINSLGTSGGTWRV